MQTKMQDKKTNEMEKKVEELFSIVVPAFNEEELIESFYKEIIDFLKLSKHVTDIEIIFIDDGSNDNTVKKVNSIIMKDNRVKLISFTKNHGVNTAFSAGLDFASGKCMIFLDVDNQYPASVIDNFAEGWRKGERIIFAKRLNYKPKILFKLSSIIFTKLMNYTSSIIFDRDTSYVCLIDRRVMDILRQLPENSRYYPGLIRWTGFDVSFIKCNINERKVGKSKIGFRKKVSEAISAITDFTSAPLRFWTVVGLGISFLSIFYGLFVLTFAFINGVDVPGYLSLFLGIVFMGGLQLISLGFLGEYITKIYNEGKNRPQYIVKEKKGFD